MKRKDAVMKEGKRKAKKIRIPLPKQRHKIKESVKIYSRKKGKVVEEEEK